MGLDMFLTRKTFKNNKEVRNSHVEVGYFRKANQIHDWFVRNVQEGEDNCEEYEVTIHDFMRLEEACNLAIKIVKEARVEEVCLNHLHVYIRYNSEEAGEGNPLPPSVGFFFGGQDYDSYYLEDLTQLLLIISQIYTSVSPKNKEYKYYYQSSW